MKTKALFFLLGVFFLLGCENSGINTVKKDLFSGYVQKGPFVNGSGVLISELDADLDQTGKIYSSRIINNQGAFEQKSIELISNYIEIKADGYYWNEVTGKASSGPIALYALADVSNVNSANINVLTHLEKSRVEYLVKNEGKDFHTAKNQAFRDILNLFHFSIPEKTTSETMNLTNDAMLLAISCIIQGRTSAVEMSELMANLSEDIRQDGTLDNNALGAQLATNARFLPLVQIRENMESKYKELGIEAEVPDFEKYVADFLENTSYPIASPITYPAEGLYGINILDKDVTTIQFDHKTDYSICSYIPEGHSLRVILRGAFSYGFPMDNWILQSTGRYSGGREYYYERDFMHEYYKEFVNKESGTTCDARISPDWPEQYYFPDFSDEPYYIVVEYYENSDVEPTYIKQVKVEYAGKRK